MKPPPGLRIVGPGPGTTQHGRVLADLLSSMEPQWSGSRGGKMCMEINRVPVHAPSFYTVQWSKGLDEANCGNFCESSLV